MVFQALFTTLQSKRISSKAAREYVAYLLRYKPWNKRASFEESDRANKWHERLKAVSYNIWYFRKTFWTGESQHSSVYFTW